MIRKVQNVLVVFINREYSGFAEFTYQGQRISPISSDFLVHNRLTRVGLYDKMIANTVRKGIKTF